MLLELFFTLAVGLTFGSFVTMASYRLPLSEDIVVKPSRCPSCETKLQFLDLWPVLSWVFSKGKCRHCKASVSIRYPLTEVATASMFVLLDLKFGITPQSLMLAILWVALMIMIVVDLEHYIIPDQLHYVLVPLGFGYRHYFGVPFNDMLEGALLGGGIGMVLHHGYRHLRKKEGLGFGDVKFLAVAGLWLGVRPVIPFLFFSGLLGVITGLLWRALGRGPIFPFGPSLAMSMYLCIVFPEASNMFWNIGQFVR